jgi:molybdopterin synthase sulfur carrier subunit
MATVSVKIPTALRALTGGSDRVEGQGNTVREVIENLDGAYPGLKARICDEENQLHRFINLYANQDDIRFLDALDTGLEDGDELSIIPAIAGGR